MREYKWYTIAFLVALMIVQPYLSKWLTVSGVSINFVLFFVMLFAFGKRRSHAIVVSVCIGFAYDMIYSVWLGKMTFVLLLAVATVFIVNRIVYKENMPVLTLYFFVSTYIIENLNTVLEVGPGAYAGSFAYIQKELFFIAVYAAALAALTGIMFYLSSLLRDRKLSPGKRRLE